ncbi:hypothetical protein EDC04DRAFT_2611253 [Pisolithus marmoratus]|nr:hypothetical protein EDC04DRAFT_2611253 [Pisolithus marmoratus]
MLSDQNGLTAEAVLSQSHRLSNQTAFHPTRLKAGGTDNNVQHAAMAVPDRYIAVLHPKRKYGGTTSLHKVKAPLSGAPGDLPRQRIRAGEEYIQTYSRPPTGYTQLYPHKRSHTMPPRTTRNSQGLRTTVVAPRREPRARAPVAAKARRARTSTVNDDECPSKKIQWLNTLIPGRALTSCGIGPEIDKESHPPDADDDTMATDMDTPPTSIPRELPHTPQQRYPYDAGSVLQTPLKRARPLQPSPTRFGDKGVHCVHEHPGLYRGNNGDYRMILNHGVGSSVNLSREEVEQLRAVEDEKIFLVQLEKLMAESNAVRLGDRVWEEDTTMDEPSQKRRVQTVGPDGTILLSGQPVHQPNHGKSNATIRAPLSNHTTGPNGEIRDRRGRRVLGPEGTILVDPTFCPGKRSRLPVPVVAEEDDDTDMENGDTKQTPLSDARHYVNAMPIRRGQPHLSPKPLGPEGTELVFY